jgi:hypothetical protein
MASEPKTYRRLPGHGSSAFENMRLYLGADHLLQVSSSGFTESYRRFYFRDIQAIVLRKSALGKVWNAVWASVFGLLAAIASGIGGPAAIAWWAVAGIFLLVLALNIGRGPTCVCQLRTAVQTRTLLSLNRLRNATRVIAQLRPLIEAAQGALPREELARRLDEARRGSVSAASAPESVAASPSPF